MSQYSIHWKTSRKIDGMLKGERNKLLKRYFCSLSFIYMISFAFLHYFFGEGSIFLNTFGVVLVDLLASFGFYTLYLFQYKRDNVNIAYEHKQIEKPFKIPLIDKNIGEESTISAFKMIFLLIIMMGMVLYYGLGPFIFSNFKFMSFPNAFGFIMFFFSIAYFDLFFEGGFKRLIFNLNRIKDLTKDDKLIPKVGFYIFMLAVAIYQIYITGIDLTLFFRTLK